MGSGSGTSRGVGPGGAQADGHPGLIGGVGPTRGKRRCQVNYVRSRGGNGRRRRHTDGRTTLSSVPVINGSPSGSGKAYVIEAASLCFRRFQTNCPLLPYY